MNDRHVRGFGRRWANHGLQARPGFVGLFVLRPRPGLAEPPRSFRSSNPEGWQRVARGRSGAETPGKQSGDPCILKGCQNCATPPGVVAQLRLRSGGIAALNHRTIWQAFGLRRQRDEGELSQQWTRRYHLGLPGSYQDPRTTILSCPSYAKWKGVADLYAYGYNRGGVAAYQSPYYGTGRHSQFGLFDNKNAEVRRLWNSDKQAHLEFPDPL